MCANDAISRQRLPDIVELIVGAVDIRATTQHRPGAITYRLTSGGCRIPNVRAVPPCWAVGWRGRRCCANCNRVERIYAQRRAIGRCDRQTCQYWTGEIEGHTGTNHIGPIHSIAGRIGTICSTRTCDHEIRGQGTCRSTESLCSQP